jgi:hypothetical protein
VYIGDSPLDGAPLYTTRCDLGRTWNGQSCEGDPDKNCWDDCSGSAIDTNITRTSDAYDGHFNTAALSVFDMGSGGGVQTSVAMNACRSLNIHGHTDWYVPSLNEMMLMRTAHTQIGDFDRTGYPTAFYHVASEEDNAFATLMSFYDGETLASTLKQYGSYMLTRCIRKGAANAEAAPTGCAAAGNSCSDGTKYAGDHPLMAGVKLYVTTADQSAGAVWGGVSANTGADSSYNGYSNQAWLMHNATAGDYPAAQLCDNLTANGHSDWYLPSRYELNVLYTNRVAIGGFGSDNYWSSTESTASNARRQSFSTGTSGSVAKSTSYRVRCVRIDNFD